jgi:hypothetical protein
VQRWHLSSPAAFFRFLYLESESTKHLASGTEKSHACAIAIGLLERVGSGYE